MLESLLNKVAGLTIATLLKVSPAQVFSFEFGKIFENIYFAQHLRTATSEKYSNGCNVLVSAGEFHI